MSFSREIKDFVSAFKTGYDMIPSKTDQDYKRARTRLENAQADYYEGKAGGALSAYDSARIGGIENQNRNRDERTKILREKPLSAAATKAADEAADETDLEEGFDALPPDEFAQGGMVRNRRFTPTLPSQAHAQPFGMALPAQVSQPRPSAMPAMPVQAQGIPAMPTAPVRPVMPAQAPTMPGQVPMRPMRGYAGGGSVEEEMGYAPYQEPSAAIPAQAAAPANGVAPNSMAAPAAGPTDEGPGFSWLAVDDAVEAGMNNLVDRYGLKSDRAVATPEFAKKVKEFNDGGSEADVKELGKLDEAVDPHKQYSEDQRNMRKLAYSYEFYINKGKPKKAAEFAGSLLKAYKGAFNRFQAISHVAAEKGDVDTAVGAALKAYAYVPDGKDIKIQKTPDGRFAFSYTDSKTGKVMQKGLKTPDEMLQIITKGGMGKFEDLVFAASDPAKAGAADAAKPSQALVDTARGGAGGPAATGAGGAEAAGPQPDAEPRYGEAKNTSEVSAMERIHREREKNRGSSKANPVFLSSKEEFDALEDGKWFVNPSDKRVLRKKAQE